MPGFLELTWGLNWWSLLWSGATIFAILHIPSVLLSRGSRPMTVLAWILCLLSLPFLGVILWWMIGLNHVERRRRRRKVSHAQMVESLADIKSQLTARQVEEGGVVLDGNGTLFNSADLFCLRQNEGIFEATTGNRLKVLPSGKHAFDAFEAAVREATEHIHFEFYIWQRDAVGRRFRDLLTQKAREGVGVRVLYDAVGGSPVSRGFMQPLIDAGGHVAPFMPLRVFERQLRINFRNHRKIIVVDRRVSFIGGVNIGEEYLDWVDMAFRFDGPISLQLQETFVEDWYFATGEDLGSRRYFLPEEGLSVGNLARRQAQQSDPSLALAASLESARDGSFGTELSVKKDTGPRPEAERIPKKLSDLEPPDVGGLVGRLVASGPDWPDSPIKSIFFIGLTHAVERLYIATPYFVPDESILVALKTAALRGVDVRILTAGMSDVWLAQAAGRSFYEELLRAGVRIFEYAEQMIHAKAVVVDYEWVVVGSANMDMRSFDLNFEVNATLRSPELNQYMSDFIAYYISKSEEMALHDFTDRPLKSRIVESTARLFSPLL
ncbi:phospholipase D-like domain-containing protein [Bradymonas sediminis]|uniref:Uncharacterized protein n=1 Tax=Bradymonas sediminis TaxID=1548548 RepID=A0A2Z4FL03_9DELT|nr:phospholipase D-like domain-containing protein [Bradymonas sediminis]AWV89485.1 hypothetical protein DN745_09090 [Bradymonas sediminis]TDP76788.1 cardiolipin synthase [Bradymonas sediminis]